MYPALIATVQGMTHSLKRGRHDIQLFFFIKPFGFDMLQRVLEWRLSRFGQANRID